MSSLNEQLVDDVIKVVSDKGLSEATVSLLRNNFPSAHFTYCMDDDINSGKVYRECDGFNVYLVNSQDHCSVITPEVEGASGLVLAEVIDD